MTKVQSGAKASASMIGSINRPVGPVRFDRRL